MGQLTVNVRAEPSPVATRIFTVDPGQALEVLDQQLGRDNQRWFEVRFKVGQSTIVGWVRADLVQEVPDAPCPTLGPGPRQ